MAFPVGRAWVHGSNDDSRSQGGVSGREGLMADIKPAEGEVDATPAALDHAKSVGVDLTKIVGTGKDGKITKSDVEAAVAAQEEEAASTPTAYFYCTEENHPGAPNFQTT